LYPPPTLLVEARRVEPEMMELELEKTLFFEDADGGTAVGVLGV